MKRLYILRHAQAGPFSSGGDKERLLTPDGHKQAQALGRTMKDRGYIPDAVLCSPAKRTRQTLSEIYESLGDLNTDYPEALYGASAQTHLSYISQLDDTLQSVLIVAHNPGVHELALFFAPPASDLSRHKPLPEHYPPATLTVVDMAISHWSEIEKASEDQVTLTEVLSDH